MGKQWEGGGWKEFWTHPSFLLSANTSVDPVAPAPAQMSLVDTVTDVHGVTWGKYQDESDPSSFFYVRSE